MTVYLIHFDQPIAPGRHTCQHYLGYAADLESRLAEHRRGTGARLLAVANARGISWQLARTWEGDRTLERRIKRRKMSPRLCPICQAQRAAERAIIQDQDNRNGAGSYESRRGIQNIPRAGMVAGPPEHAPAPSAGETAPAASS